MDVTVKAARDVTTDDLVMTPVGPKPIREIKRHSKTRRLIFRYGSGLSTFGRTDDEPVYLAEEVTDGQHA